MGNAQTLILPTGAGGASVQTISRARTCRFQSVIVERQRTVGFIVDDIRLAVVRLQNPFEVLPHIGGLIGRLFALRNVKALVGAVREGTGIRGDGCRLVNTKSPQVGAAVECAGADSGDSGGNIHECQAGAVGKGILTNGRQALGQVDSRQATASDKGID